MGSGIQSVMRMECTVWEPRAATFARASTVSCNADMSGDPAKLDLAENAAVEGVEHRDEVLTGRAVALGRLRP
jgi:hypothetical protein